MSNIANRLKNNEVYAVKHKDDNVRMESRSGGIFTALSDYFLKNNGVVYGCALNESFVAVHIRASNELGRNKMRGSKYSQSNLGEMFSAVKKDLDTGKSVLFSGTSCQIAGLLSFLRKDYENLLTLDIVCHGVPSPMIWQDYLHWQEKTHNGKCVKVDFRNKKVFGWAAHFETLYIEIAGKIKTVHSDIYRNLFYRHMPLRPSCYKCPYKSINHPSDITIADYWGIEKAAPGFDDNKGVSLVLVNSAAGKDLFEKVQNDIIVVPCRIEDSLQDPLKAPFPKPDGRDTFWKEYHEKGFLYITKKYAGNNLKTKVDKKYAEIRKIIKKFLQKTKLMR